MFVSFVLGFALISLQIVAGNIIIIGAGPSGIAAASKLIEKGYTNITILEAENRIGGRIYSTFFGSKKVDLGAQWIMGQEKNIVYELAKPLGLVKEENYTFDNIYFGHLSQVNLNQTLAHSILNYVEEMQLYLENNEISSGSLGNLFIDEYFKRQNPSDPNFSSLLLLPESIPILDWYKYCIEVDESSSDSWYETAAYGVNTWEDLPGIQTVIWLDGGYHNIIDILMKVNPELLNKNIHLNKEVTRIYWDQKRTDTSGIFPKEGNVIVRCSDGTLYEADHIIITTSVGVLKDKVHSLFHPALPDQKIIAIKGIGFGPVDKIYLEFKERWWTNEEKGFGLLWTEEDRKHFNFSFPGSLKSSSRHWLTEIKGFFELDFRPNILCAWVVGDAAKQMELASDEEVLEGSYYLLKLFFEDKFNITKPINILRSAWYKNPHFRGSYSHLSVETIILNTNASMLAEPIVNSNGKPILLFAGEATNQKHYGSVHGAIESGFREAERLSSWFNNNS